MGQSFSSGNHIFIQVDRPYYSPGDPVNGQVMLNCVTPFQASALVLKIEGYERTRWEERQERTSFEGSDNRSITRETIYPHSGKKDIFKIKIPLQIYSQNVQPGQYQFPFGCILPLGLPGSFEYSANNLYYQGNQHNYLKAKIRYKVKAECEIPGMLKHNLRAKQHLTVLQRMERPPSQVVVEDRQSVKACCCCDKGYAYITAHVEKDSYFPGETVNVILQIDNQSTVEFSSVQLQLHRTLRLRSDGAGQHESDEKLAESKMPGVKAGEKQMGKDGARRISLQLPSALQSGASGQLVECIYTLEVKLKASSFMSDPTLKLPIMIYQAIPQYQAYAAPPPFWQPAVVPPPVQVEIPSAPPMPPMGQVMGMPAPGKYEPPQPTYGGPQ